MIGAGGTQTSTVPPFEGRSFPAATVGAILEAAPAAMIVVSGEGRILHVNAQADALFGYAPGELLGEDIERLLPERYRKGHLRHRLGYVTAPSARPMGAIGQELFGRRKDGTEFPAAIGMSPVETEAGLLVTAAIRDLTRERLEAQVRQQNRELLEKNEEVEAFVYIVSHDLRAPLVNLQGFAAELATSCGELGARLAAVVLPPEMREPIRAILEEDIPTSLRYIRASTNKFQRLIDAMLMLSRTGRQDYRREELDLEALVATTLDSLRLSIEQAGAHIVAGALPRARGDATAVGQVLSNLISNALQYRAPERPGLIEIGGEVNETMNHYWVKDNGVGIAAAAQPRLFQVFQRFHPSLSPGEGMGLAVVKRIVERHGGRVWAESQEGAGTTLHLTLPPAGG